MAAAALFLLLLGNAVAAAPEGGVTDAELLEQLREVTREVRQLKESRARDHAQVEALTLALARSEGRRLNASVNSSASADASVDSALDASILDAINRSITDLQNATDEVMSALAANITDLQGTLASSTADLAGAMDYMWLLLCGALVMFMQAGFALLEAGCCRSKNVQNIMMKNLMDVCAGTLCWWAFGWAFAYGGTEAETRFGGSSEFFGIGFLSQTSKGVIEPAGGQQRDWFFQWAFCSAAATIVSGGVAERVNFPGYLIYTFFMTSVIYPIVVAWTWSGNGWLQGMNDVGYMDFAGSGIVHMCGGVGALVGAAVVGPRSGRWDPERQDDFDPHSLPLIVLGTFILWFGWYGFNCGSTLGLSSTEVGQLAASVAMNTTISAATGGITVLALRLALLHRYDIGGMCNGILAGLVSITAPCGNVYSGTAFIIGLVGALIYQGASMLLRKVGVDDPIDAFPVHGAAGMWGALAAAIFDWGAPLDIYHGWGGFACTTGEDDECLKGGRGQAFAANLAGVISIAAWTAILSLIIMLPLKFAGLLRADEGVQEQGMDTAKHSPTKAYNVSDSEPVTFNPGSKKVAPA